VDLLHDGLVVFEGDYYYLLAHLPKHDASDRCPVRTSENAVEAKFSIAPVQPLSASPAEIGTRRVLS
jgi:hypothetical protein